MQLRHYQPDDFALLAQWITGPELLFQFAGTEFSYPLTSAQLETYQNTFPDRLFYMACFPNQQPFAFGEIIPQDNNIPRLARLLVGYTEQRGKGLGTRFVQLLSNECVRLYQCSYIELYVLADNIQAQRCYQKVGFSFLPDAKFQLIVDHQPYTIQKMRLPVSRLSADIQDY